VTVAEFAEQKNRPAKEAPYDVVRIYDILQEVRVDDSGNMIIESNAKRALKKRSLSLARKFTQGVFVS